MDRPRVFIGSSSEGLPIAEAVFAALSRETDPTLWTHQIFTPGAYPLEALDEALRRHSFAILIASPDDEITKRGISTLAMRDNILLEFGLSAGALGRRRTYFICPDQPKVDVPSDLFGITVTTYAAERAQLSPSDCAAAVQVACQQIRDTIREQWAILQEIEADRGAKIRGSKETQAVQRLYTVAAVLRDALMALQRDSFAALSDRFAFEAVKKNTMEEVRRITQGFLNDAELVGVGTELENLRAAAEQALLTLPFPEELAPGREAIKNKAIDVGVGALGAWLHGGDPVGHVQQAAEDDAAGRLTSLARRYGAWWDEHSTKLQSASVRLQDALMTRMIRISSDYPRSG